MIKYEDFRDALFKMAGAGEINLPYGVAPRIKENVEISPAFWGMVIWNPPQGHVHLTEPDPDASDKPTFEAVVNMHHEDIYTVGILVAELSKECRARIVTAYGAMNWQDEIEYRVRTPAADLEPMDTERDRLRAVYKAQRQALSTMTLEERMAYDPTADSIWVAPD